LNQKKSTTLKYTKPFVTFNDQIKSLKYKNLEVKSDKFILEKLSTISFYRFRAYTYPFQDNKDPSHPFNKKISFEEIYALYDFDSQLRNLLFNAIEKIEIALRTQIIYNFAKSNGNHWQLDKNLYRDSYRYNSQMQSLTEELNRSDETFIKHYFDKYTDPAQPPSWMSLEVASLGLLSKIYQNLKKGESKESVSKFFGLKNVSIIENWMQCFCNLRNICAHHGRVWNRRYTTKPFLPYNTKVPFLSKEEIKTIYPNKLYAVLCCIYYMVKQIDSSSDFKSKLVTLIKSCPLTQESEMGFPKNWETQTVWRD
jgi:abortive infection bacteriophage resistance protein